MRQTLWDTLVIYSGKFSIRQIIYLRNVVKIIRLHTNTEMFYYLDKNNTLLPTN